MFRNQEKIRRDVLRTGLAFECYTRPLFIGGFFLREHLRFGGTMAAQRRRHKRDRGWAHFALVVFERITRHWGRTPILNIQRGPGRGPGQTPNPKFAVSL